MKTLNALREAHPDLCAAVAAQAATAERERVLAILALPAIGMEALKVALARDAAVTPEAAAERILRETHDHDEARSITRAGRPPKAASTSRRR